jgi:hypothetical protein
MTYIINYRFYTSKSYKLRSVSDRDILFFGNNRRDTSQSLFCFDSEHTLTNIHNTNVSKNGPYKDQLVYCLKGNVQRKLRWFESGINQLVYPQ